MNRSTHLLGLLAAVLLVAAQFAFAATPGVTLPGIDKPLRGGMTLAEVRTALDPITVDLMEDTGLSMEYVCAVNTGGFNYGIFLVFIDDKLAGVDFLANDAAKKLDDWFHTQAKALPVVIHSNEADDLGSTDLWMSGSTEWKCLHMIMDDHVEYKSTILFAPSEAE